MELKGSLCCFVILVSFFVCGSLANTWAGEKELIQLLVKKNILTQQEADQLLEEVKSTAIKEKEETKKEVKAELQEEIKKDAVKGEFLPPALQGFKFGTTIYADWDYITRSRGPNKVTNQFSLTRAYVTLTKEFNDWLSMNITSDLFTSRDINDVNNGLDLRLKFAFVDVKLLGTDSLLGLIPTPSDYYDSAIWPFRVQSQNLLDGLGIQSTADLGVVNSGAFGGYMDEEYLKYAAKSTAGKWGGYMVGVYNGAGFDTPENNMNKVVSGLVYFRPFPDRPFWKGLQLAYTGTYGESNNNFASGSGSTRDYPTWQLNVAQASLQHSYFTVMGQYYWGKGTKNSTEQNKRRAYLVDAFMRIPSVEKLRAFGKWYYYDPNTDRSRDQRNVYVAGLSYDASKEFMPFVAWEHQDSGRNSAVVDYDKYQVGFQLKY
jgi:hypothetical protein